MAAARDPLVVFTPSGKRGNFPVGTPLLQAARSLGVDIDSVCGGRALCGRCQVLVAEGEFAKLGVSSSSESLSPISEPELRFARRVPLAEGRRLSCSARVEADVVIDVPASSQVHRQVVRKGFEAARNRTESGRAAALRASEAARHARSVGRSAPAV